MGVIIAIVVVVLIVLFVITAYNGLIRLKNKVDAAWAQVDVQLKRRYDLIPNLVETVKGYAAHEKDTFEAVVAARNSAMSAGGSGPAAQADAENALSGTLKSLFALSEAYPDLKANTNFLNLQEELTATEDKIAYSRQFYNGAVQELNTKIQVFPSSLLAGMAKATAREYFKTDEAERGPVKVQF